jgi:transposase-like protein
MPSDNTVDFGSGGGVVEVDETFIGQKYKKPEGARGYAHKNAVLTLIDSNSGQSKSFVVDDVKASTLLPILRENIAKEAIVYTDEAKQYGSLGSEFADHNFTTHSKGQYVRGNVHTNTAEGYFSIFKRGMKGVYQHCGKQHLHRYAAEFEFRYNNRIANGVNDLGRVNVALMGIVGKRVLYRDSLGA